jgi:hypothetical protein
MQEIVCRFQPILPGGPGDLYDTFRFTRFSLHNKHFTPLLCAEHNIACGGNATGFLGRQAVNGWYSAFARDRLVDARQFQKSQ